MTCESRLCCAEALLTIRESRKERMPAAIADEALAPLHTSAAVRDALRPTLPKACAAAHFHLLTRLKPRLL